MNRISKILYVEDDQLDQLVMKRTLKGLELKSELTMAGSVEEGTQLAAQTTFDCIFLDFMLPDGSGIDFLKAIRAAGNESPVIMLTSQGDAQIAVEAMKSGAMDYIPKNLITPEGL